MTAQDFTKAPPPRDRAPRTGPGTRLATRPLMRWRGVDLITAAMLAVAFGVMFWGFDTFIYPILTTATAGFPPVGELMLGVWLIPAVVGALVVRRPGAAVFTELVAANVELFLGNKWGAAVLLSGVLQGLGVELAVALFRHRRFGLAVAVLGGTLSAAFEIVFYEWYSYVAGSSTAWQANNLARGLGSGGMFRRGGGLALAVGLVREGALNAFPPGPGAGEPTLACRPAWPGVVQGRAWRRGHGSCWGPGRR